METIIVTKEQLADMQVAEADGTLTYAVPPNATGIAPDAFSAWVKHLVIIVPGNLHQQNPELIASLQFTADLVEVRPAEQTGQLLRLHVATVYSAQNSTQPMSNGAAGALRRLLERVEGITLDTQITFSVFAGESFAVKLQSYGADTAQQVSKLANTYYSLMRSYDEYWRHLVHDVKRANITTLAMLSELYSMLAEEDHTLFIARKTYYELVNIEARIALAMGDGVLEFKQAHPYSTVFTVVEHIAEIFYTDYFEQRQKYCFFALQNYEDLMKLMSSRELDTQNHALLRWFSTHLSEFRANSSHAWQTLTRVADLSANIEKYMQDIAQMQVFSAAAGASIRTSLQVAKLLVARAQMYAPLINSFTNIRVKGPAFVRKSQAIATEANRQALYKTINMNQIVQQALETPRLLEENKRAYFATTGKAYVAVEENELQLLHKVGLSELSAYSLFRVEDPAFHACRSRPVAVSIAESGADRRRPTVTIGCVTLPANSKLSLNWQYKGSAVAHCLPAYPRNVNQVPAGTRVEILRNALQGSHIDSTGRIGGARYPAQDYYRTSGLANKREFNKAYTNDEHVTQPSSLWDVGRRLISYAEYDALSATGKYDLRAMDNIGTGQLEVVTGCMVNEFVQAAGLAAGAGEPGFKKDLAKFRSKKADDLLTNILYLAKVVVEYTYKYRGVPDAAALRLYKRSIGGPMLEHTDIRFFEYIYGLIDSLPANPLAIYDYNLLPLNDAAIELTPRQVVEQYQKYLQGRYHKAITLPVKLRNKLIGLLDFSEQSAVQLNAKLMVLRQLNEIITHAASTYHQFMNIKRFKDHFAAVNELYKKLVQLQTRLCSERLSIVCKAMLELNSIIDNAKAEDDIQRALMFSKCNYALIIAMQTFPTKKIILSGLKLLQKATANNAASQTALALNIHFNYFLNLCLCTDEEVREKALDFLHRNLCKNNDYNSVLLLSHPNLLHVFRTILDSSTGFTSKNLVFVLARRLVQVDETGNGHWFSKLEFLIQAIGLKEENKYAAAFIQALARRSYYDRGKLAVVTLLWQLQNEQMQSARIIATISKVFASLDSSQLTYVENIFNEKLLPLISEDLRQEVRDLFAEAKTALTSKLVKGTPSVPQLDGTQALSVLFSYICRQGWGYGVDAPVSIIKLRQLIAQHSLLTSCEAFAAQLAPLVAAKYKQITQLNRIELAERRENEKTQRFIELLGSVFAAKETEGAGKTAESKFQDIATEIMRNHAPQVAADVTIGRLSYSEINRLLGLLHLPDDALVNKIKLHQGRNKYYKLHLSWLVVLLAIRLEIDICADKVIEPQLLRLTLNLVKETVQSGSLDSRFNFLILFNYFANNTADLPKAVRQQIVGGHIATAAEVFANRKVKTSADRAIHGFLQQLNNDFNKDRCLPQAR